MKYQTNSCGLKQPRNKVNPPTQTMNEVTSLLMRSSTKLTRDQQRRSDNYLSFSLCLPPLNIYLYRRDTILLSTVIFHWLDTIHKRVLPWQNLGVLCYSKVNISPSHTHLEIQHIKNRHKTVEFHCRVYNLVDAFVGQTCILLHKCMGSRECLNACETLTPILLGLFLLVFLIR